MLLLATVDCLETVMCVVGLGVSPGIRIRLTNLMATFHTLYAVNYLGTAERVFELVFPSSHAWKCSFSCEDSCSVPTVVYVAEGGRLRTCGLNPRPFLLWPFVFFSAFFSPPPPTLITFFLPSSPQDGMTLLQRFVSRGVRIVPPPYRM